MPWIKAILLLLPALSLAASAAPQTNLVTLATGSAWTWYNDPRALFHNGALYFGCVRKSDGASTLNVLDLWSGATRTLWTSTRLETDDHDNPGLLALQDGRLLAIHARHGTDSTFSYRRSLLANPVTASAWGPEQTIPPTGAGLTYANPYQLSAEGGRVYDFSRDLNFNPTVFTSADGGANWSAPTLFIKTGSGSSVRPYVKYCSDYASRIDALYTDGHPRDVNNSLYHLYYQAGALYQTDGTFLRSFSALPLLHDAGERGSVIYQYSDADTADPNDHIPTGRAWCWEVVAQTNDRPACVFTVQRDNIMGSDWTGDRIYYYYAHWTGTNWQKRFIAHAGRPLYNLEDDYAGGIALDPEDPSTVYLSSDAANPFNLATTTNVPLGAHYELYKGLTTNGGLSFAWSALTTNSTMDNLRPYVPRNRRGAPALVWFRGTYVNMGSFDTTVVGLLTNTFPGAKLVAYWPLDAATGGTTPDLALGNSLTLYGSPPLTGGTRSNAFSFDGSSQYLSIAHSPSGGNGLPVFQPGGVCTIALWVRGPAQTARYLFAESSTTDNNPIFLLQTGQSSAANNKLDIILRTSSGPLVNHIVSTRTVFDSTWHHVAYVDSAGAVQVYVDGNADTNFTYAPSGSLTVNATSLGALVRSSISGYFSGAMDDALAWQRALTQAEIQSVMANSITVPAPAPPAIAYQSPGSTNALGDYVTFSAEALGAPPFAYQWLKNGVPLPGRTSNVLLLATEASGSNSYAVSVANSVGSITGAPIPFVVLPDPAPDLAGGLVSWWPFDTLSTNAGFVSSPDLYSGNDMVLAAMGSPNLVAGRFGKALSFDGLRQCGQRAGGVPIYLTANYSVSLWVKGPSGQINKQVFAEGGSSGNFFSLGTETSGAGGHLAVQVNPGLAERKSTRTVFDNTWHHVVWADENGKGRLYVDGVLDETDFTYVRANPLLETTVVAALVRAAPTNYFAGSLDELALWDRRLTWTELAQLATNGIPASLAPIPPAIFVQPNARTNGIFVGDSVTFSVLASGTVPLRCQWRKNGVVIPPPANPSATSNVLALANLQPADAGAYCVVVANAGGAVTSSVVQLAVTTYTPVTNGVVLQLDFDLPGSGYTQPGFQAFTLDGNGAAYDEAVQVTLAPIGGITLADRQRGFDPFVVLDNPPALTQARIYNDFVLAYGTADGNGLSILLSRLAPNTRYGLTIWSFDPQSGGARVSDWTETASGTPIPIVTGYTFDGLIHPTADADDTFGALLTSSPAGRLQIQGVRHGGTSYGVFLNALELVANPAIRITAAQPIGNGKLRLILQAQYSGQSLAIQQSPSLSSPSWVPAADGLVIQTHGPVLTMEFSQTSTQMFYRATATQTHLPGP